MLISRSHCTKRQGRHIECQADCRSKNHGDECLRVLITPEERQNMAREAGAAMQEIRHTSPLEAGKDDLSCRDQRWIKHVKSFHAKITARRSDFTVAFLGEAMAQGTAELAMGLPMPCPAGLLSHLAGCSDNMRLLDGQATTTPPTD